MLVSIVFRLHQHFTSTALIEAWGLTFKPKANEQFLELLGEGGVSDLQGVCSSTLYTVTTL